jgi:hypothetical protein
VQLGNSPFRGYPYSTNEKARSTLMKQKKSQQMKFAADELSQFHFESDEIKAAT